MRIALLVTGGVLVAGGLVSMARDWVWLKAQLGGTDSQLVLAHAYATGQGVERDEEEASAWYLRAARAGDVRAQKAIAGRYDQGLGVEADPAEATHWYRKAAEGRDSDSQFRMALRYSGGLGVPRDRVRAAMWLIVADRYALQFSDGADLRDALKRELSETELAEARRLAADWRRAHGGQG